MDISVIVPFYNGNKYINHIYEMFEANLRNLSHGVYAELLIVNDSPWIEINQEGYPDILGKGYVRILNYSDNVGIHGARIRGINEASGNYILMLDQDDEIDSSFLEDMLNHIEDADVCVANGYLCKPNGDKKIYISSEAQEKIKNLFYYIYLENRILSPGHCLIRKEAIPTEWLECPLENNGADDLFLWILMLSNKCKFKANYKDLYWHIDTGNNVSKDELGMAKSVLEVCNIIKEMPRLVPSWVPFLLERKVKNDIWYAENGCDRYIDYRVIELLRKKLQRTRN